MNSGLPAIFRVNPPDTDYPARVTLCAQVSDQRACARPEPQTSDQNGFTIRGQSHGCFRCLVREGDPRRFEAIGGSE
jgi:hypothetical protein